MGGRSKFLFPLPGRRNRDEPQSTITAPLSKAQRILGTGEINLDSSGRKKEFETWEAHSSSGVSISVSDSSMGLTSTTYQTEQYDSVPKLGSDIRGWDEDSDVFPRRLHSATSPGLRSKKSAATLGIDFFDDGATDASSLRRRQSNSTIGEHYDKTHVPLSVSQQTSNSAIALGHFPGHIQSPSPANERKKRPSKLDLLMGKARQDRTAGAKSASPHLGGDHVLVRSPSMMSFKSSWGAPSPGTPEQRTPNKLVRRSQQPTLKVPTPTNQHRPVRDTTGLHQLYDHYEEMSFRNAPSPTEEEAPAFLTSDPYDIIPRPHTARTSTSLPAPKPTIREPESPSDHSSTRTRNLTSGSGGTDPMDSTISSITDYAGSISSRHTGTSKTSRTGRSIQSLDRQQNSILSLSDSDSDEDAETSIPRSTPSPHYMTAPTTRDLSSPMHEDTSILPSSRYAGPEPKSIKTVKEFLDIPRASSRTSAPRPRSNSTLRSQHSSTSTISPLSGLSTSSDPSQHSGHSTGSDDESSPAQVHEAHSITFRPLASTAEAAMDDVATETFMSPMMDFHQLLLRKSSQSQTKPRDSRSSGQPTPPLSPSSVEFYFPAPEPTEQTRRSSVASNSSEKNNARFMAVTRQEEMLLAALREKRAKMRASSLSSGSAATDKGSRTSEMLAKASQGHPIPIPQRRSSVMTSKSLESTTAEFAPKGLGVLPEGEVVRPRTAAAASSEALASSPERPASAKGSSTRAGKARQERVLLYLEEPISRVNAIDLAEPSPDLTEFMGSVDGRSDDEWAEDSRRARVKTTRWTQFSKHGFFVKEHENGRPRADSAAVTPKLLQDRVPPLAGLPEDQFESGSEDEEDDMYLDDFDFDDFPEPGGKVVDSFAEARADAAARGPGPSSPLPPLPNKAKAPITHKPNRSLARLSAVGGPVPDAAPSPIPWWGDDD